MIKGVEILNKVEIMTTSTENNCLFYMAILFAIATIVCSCIILTLLDNRSRINFKFISKIEKLSIVFTVISFSCLIMIPSTSSKNTPTGKYQYQVTISDEVSMNDFNSKYKVISQDGEIYTIEEKDNDK